MRKNFLNIEPATAMKEEMKQSWNKLLNLQKNREKETIMKLLNAFWNYIAGILIISPKYNKEFCYFIANFWETFKSTMLLPTRKRSRVN